jgi:regulator of replication initiation timing
MPWQAQSFSNFSSHIFVSKGASKNFSDMFQAVMHSSLATLALQAQVSDLKLQITTLTAENHRLYAENDRLEDKCLQQELELLKVSASSSNGNYKLTPTRHLNAAAGPSRTAHDATQAQDHRQYTDTRPRSSQFTSAPFQVPMGSDGIAEAYRLQQLYDEEDKRLRAEQEALAAWMQHTFNCGICMDEHPEDYVARIDKCGHQFCRECILGHISSTLGEHRFPVLCPICTAEKGVREPGG